MHFWNAPQGIHPDDFSVSTLQMPVLWIHIGQQYNAPTFSANERRRYFVTASLIGQAQT